MKRTQANRLQVDGIALKWQRIVPGRPPNGFGLFVPADPNAVLENFTDEEFVETDERLPYFSTLWPAAEAMTWHILHGPELHGMRILDLGCGVGAVGLAAAQKGARVTLLDWEPRAIRIARMSARSLKLDLEHSLVADWRDSLALRPFDRILGADVLYEQRNVAAVALFLKRYLRRDGQAWIADPGRHCAKEFPEQLRQAGLHTLERRKLPSKQSSTVEVLRVVIA